MYKLMQATVVGVFALALSTGATGIAYALPDSHGGYHETDSMSFTRASDSVDDSSVEELFTEYVMLDDNNYMYVNVEKVRNSPYAQNLAELENFVLLMNEINIENLGYGYRDAWSFAKCVIADAVGVNMVARLTNGLYMAIRAAQWPLAAKTILQIGASAGLNLGWKANAVGLAIALGKSAIYCRGEI